MAQLEDFSVKRRETRGSFSKRKSRFCFSKTKFLVFYQNRWLFAKIKKGPKHFSKAISFASLFFNDFGLALVVFGPRQRSLLVSPQFLEESFTVKVVRSGLEC